MSINSYVHKKDLPPILAIMYSVDNWMECIRFVKGFTRWIIKGGGEENCICFEINGNWISAGVGNYIIKDQWGDYSVMLGGEFMELFQSITEEAPK